MLSFKKFKKMLNESNKEFFKEEKEAVIKGSIDEKDNCIVEVNGTRSLLMNILYNIIISLIKNSSLTEDEITTMVALALAGSKE